MPGLTRADRELVEDTFRVTSLSLSNLQGAASIPPYITTDVRRGYEFRVYQQLGELYIKQERVKDAADTFGAFAQRAPSHPEAPVLQARVIDIYAAGRLRQPGPRGEEAVRVATTASAATTSAPTRRAGRAASRW